MIVSVDPGLRACGVAYWTPSGLLVSAKLIESDYEGPKLETAVWRMVNAVNFDDAFASAKLVAEIPQVYRGSRLKGDPNDLISLALVVGGISGNALKYYRPREWKGQVPKNVMISRIKSKLTREELKNVRLPNKSLQHNVWDAIGIGLKYFARI